MSARPSAPVSAPSVVPTICTCACAIGCCVAASVTRTVILPCCASAAAVNTASEALTASAHGILRLTMDVRGVHPFEPSAEGNASGRPDCGAPRVQHRIGLAASGSVA